MENKEVTYSYSRLHSYHNCQYGFYLNYIKKVEGVQNIYSYLGGVTHELLEKMQVNEMTNEEAVRLFTEAYEGAEELGYKFATKSAEDGYVNSIKHYLATFKPYVAEGVEIEKEFRLEFEGVKLLGYIDLILVEKDGSVKVIDHKTSSEFKKADLDDYGTQLVIYGLALEQMGYNVSYLGWSMLKYGHAKFNGGRSKKILRNKIGVHYFNKIREQLFLIGEDDEEKLDELALGGSILDLPKQVSDMFEVEPLMVEYKMTDEARKRVLKWIKDTVDEIETKEMLDSESLWEHLNIEEDDFFCNTLCNQRHNCKFLKAHKQSFAEENEVSLLMKELESFFD